MLLFYRTFAALFWAFFTAVLPAFLIFKPCLYLFLTGKYFCEAHGLALYNDLGPNLLLYFWGGVCMAIGCTIYMYITQWIERKTEKTIRPWFMHYFSGD